MRTLLIRRARAQAGVLAGLLALVTLTVVPLGVAALLLGPSAQRAFDVAMARQPVDAVDVTAYVTGVPGGAARGVVADTRSAVTGILDPLPVTTAVRTSSAVRALPGKRAADVGYLGAVDDPARYVRVMAGRTPMAGAPIPEAVVPQPVATQLGLRAGDTVQLGDEVASDRHVRPMTVRVVGVVEPLPAAGWNRDPLDGAGVNRRFFVSPRLPSATAYGPFLLPLDDLVRSGSTLDRLDVTGHPELARPARPALDAVDARFGSANPRLTAAVSARAGTERVSSALPATLATVRTEESVTGASVLVVVLLTMGLSVAALALAGRLVVALRKDETDLLGAFGASPRQLASVAGIEGGIVALVATAVAVPLAGLAHAALTRLAVVRRAGLAGTAAATPASVLVIAVGAAALAAVLVVPAVFAVTGGRADRLDRHGLLLRSGVDLLAVALAGIGLWQLRAQPPVSTGPDVVRTVAPVLCLVAGSLLVLRAVPPLLAAADARARSSPALVLPLAAIEASRRPRAAAAALLVTLGAASGCFASALLATWDAAQRDQADLRVGTDLSVTPTSPPAASQAALLADATGGTVSPALRRNVLIGGWLGEPGAPPQLVAVDTSRAGQLLRGRAPEGGTWSEVGAGLTPADPVRGVPVAAPTSATLTGTASNGVGVSAVPRLVVQTPSGLRVGFEAAQVPFDGHAHRLVLAQPLPGGGELIAVDLQLSATANGPPAADVSSTAVTADLRLPGPAVTRQRWTARSAGIQPERLVSPAVRLDTVDGGSDVHLSAVGVAPELSDAPVDLVATAFAAPAAVPVAVSQDLAAAAHLHVGGGFAMTVGTTPVPARVTQVVPDVPSVPGGPAVLADLDLVSRALLAAGDTSVAADAWWIADVGISDAPARVRALGLGTVAGRAETTEELAAGPLRVAVPVALAGLALLVVVLVLAGAGLAVSTDLEARAVEIARLRAVGLRRSDVRRGLVAQHGTVLGVLVLAGAAVAAVAARVLGPLLVRSDTGGDPVPGVRPLWPWPVEAGLIGVLLLGAATVVTVLVARRVRRADAVRLRFGAS